MLTLKFGGTSLKDAAAMRQAISIVRKVKDKKTLVVLSATAGTTDLLINIAKAAAKKYKPAVNKLVNNISNNHLNIIEGLFSVEELKAETLSKVSELIKELKTFAEGIALLGECTQQMLDSAAAFGEMMSSVIFEAACRNSGLITLLKDARKVLKIENKNGIKIDHKFLSNRVQPHFVKQLKAGKIVITQGYIGADERNRSATLGRGGSDYSAALFGAAIRADEIQIWTDVNGVLTADPKVIKNVRTIPVLSYSEMQDMAFYGAKVLHPEAIKPAIEKNIPLRILNTFEPDNPGTLIVSDAATTDDGFKAVVLLEKCTLLHFTSKKFEAADNIASQFLSMFKERGFKIYMMLGTDNSLQIVTEHKKIYLENLRYLLPQFSILHKPVSILCLVGKSADENNMIELTQKIFKIARPISIGMSRYSSSNLFIIKAGDENKILRKVHNLVI